MAKLGMSQAHGASLEVAWVAIRPGIRGSWTTWGDILEIIGFGVSQAQRLEVEPGRTAFYTKLPGGIKVQITRLPNGASRAREGGFLTRRTEIRKFRTDFGPTG